MSRPHESDLPARLPAPPLPATRAWHEQVAALSRPLNELPDPLPIPLLPRAFDASVRPPGSKSLTNRALLLAALGEGESRLTHALTDADDAKVMLAALSQLGARVESRGDELVVHGVGGRWRVGPSGVTLNLNNAGTATRFLTAAALLAPPDCAGIIIDGNARMRERPIGELASALLAMGARVEYLARAGFPPLRVGPADASLRTSVEFGTTASSQFISALMLVAPCLPGGLTISSREPVTSPSYIAMTRDLLRRVGVRGDFDPVAGSGRTLHTCIDHQSIKGFSLAIEPDASGATYFEAAAAMTPGARCVIEGLDAGPAGGPRASMQGDTGFIRVLTEFGAGVERVHEGLRVRGGESPHAIDADLSDMPDTAMTAAVLACFAARGPSGPASTLRGLRTLRVKETDRLEALRTELSKLGARIEIVSDGADESLRITPGPTPGPDDQIAGGGAVVFDTYDDHRMAMALALVGLRRAGVWIRDPACVRKTYPRYFEHLSRLYV